MRPQITIALVAFLSVFPGLACGGERISGPVKARLLDVRDGDTIEVLASVWPQHEVRVFVRLRGIDAPEISGNCAHERQLARAARDRLQQMLSQDHVHLRDISGGKYFGRVLASVIGPASLDVQKALMKEGHVRPYFGKRRKSWCDAADMTHGKPSG